MPSGPRCSNKLQKETRHNPRSGPAADKTLSALKESKLGGIFVSYRRSDSQGEAGRLFDDLVKHFGEHAVFMDVVAIEAGRDFRKAIEEGVVRCGVLLTLMGPGWLSAKDEAGVLRLNDPTDFVRIETASALKRDIPVIPVLVRGAQMPRADQLPNELKELAYRNCIELTHARWRSDIQVLIESLRRVVGESSRIEADPGKVTLRPPPPQYEAENSGRLHADNSSRIDPAAIERVIRGLAVLIGPIASVVVKRAVPHCSSVEDLYRKVAEELDSTEDRDKFLRGVAIPLTPSPDVAHAKMPAANSPVRLKVPPLSDAEDTALGKAAAPRRQSKYFLVAGAGIALLILCIFFALRFSRSRGEASAEPMHSAENKPAETSVEAGPEQAGSEAAVVPASGAPRQTHPVPIPEELARGLLIKTVLPVYPPLARQAHIQGEVVLDTEISKEGIVEELRTLKGHPMLIPAAVDAVKQWRYKPYIVNGEPVAVDTQVVVNFTLK